MFLVGTVQKMETDCSNPKRQPFNVHKLQEKKIIKKNIFTMAVKNH